MKFFFTLERRAPAGAPACLAVVLVAPPVPPNGDHVRFATLQGQLALAPAGSAANRLVTCAPPGCMPRRSCPFLPRRDTVKVKIREQSARQRDSTTFSALWK